MPVPIVFDNLVVCRYYVDRYIVSKSILVLPCRHTVYLTLLTLFCFTFPLQLDPGNKEAVKAARRIKDKVAKAAKLNTPIVQVRVKPRLSIPGTAYKHTI